MKTLIGLLLSAMLLFPSGIHIYRGLGGKGVSLATIPTNEDNKPVMNPGAVDCFVVAIVLLGFGVFILIKSGIIFFNLPNWLLSYGLWAIAAIFLLRAIGEFKYVGFFKKIKATKFGQLDTKYYSPLCLIVGLLCVILEFMA